MAEKQLNTKLPSANDKHVKAFTCSDKESQNIELNKILDFHPNLIPISDEQNRNPNETQKVITSKSISTSTEKLLTKPPVATKFDNTSNIIFQPFNFCPIKASEENTENFEIGSSEARNRIKSVDVSISVPETNNYCQTSQPTSLMTDSYEKILRFPDQSTSACQSSGAREKDKWKKSATFTAGSDDGTIASSSETLVGDVPSDVSIDDPSTYMLDLKLTSRNIENHKINDRVTFSDNINRTFESFDGSGNRIVNTNLKSTNPLISSGDNFEGPSCRPKDRSRLKRQLKKSWSNQETLDPPNSPDRRASFTNLFSFTADDLMQAKQVKSLFDATENSSLYQDRDNYVDESSFHPTDVQYDGSHLPEESYESNMNTKNGNENDSALKAQITSNDISPKENYFPPIPRINLQTDPHILHRKYLTQKAKLQNTRRLAKQASAADVEDIYYEIPKYPQKKIIRQQSLAYDTNEYDWHIRDSGESFPLPGIRISGSNEPIGGDLPEESQSQDIFDNSSDDDSSTASSSSIEDSEFSYDSSYLQYTELGTPASFEDFPPILDFPGKTEQASPAIELGDMVSEENPIAILSPSSSLPASKPFVLRSRPVSPRSFSLSETSSSSTVTSSTSPASSPSVLPGALTTHNNSSCTDLLKPPDGAMPRRGSIVTCDTMQASLQPQPEPVKIVVLGDEGVGKTAVIVRLVTGRFIGDYDPSLEAVYSYKLPVEGCDYLLQVMDTAGQAGRQGEQTQLNWAEGVVVIFSVTSKKSLEVAQGILERLYTSEHQLRGHETVKDTSSSNIGESADEYTKERDESHRDEEQTGGRNASKTECVRKELKSESVSITNEPESKVPDTVTYETRSDGSLVAAFDGKTANDKQDKTSLSNTPRESKRNNETSKESKPLSETKEEVKKYILKPLEVDSNSESSASSDQRIQKLKPNDIFGTSDVILGTPIAAPTSKKLLEESVSAVGDLEINKQIINKPTILLGNKADLNHRREVLGRTGFKLADSFGCMFKEIAASAPWEEVSKPFVDVYRAAMKRRELKQTKKES